MFDGWLGGCLKKDQLIERHIMWSVPGRVSRRS